MVLLGGTLSTEKKETICGAFLPSKNSRRLVPDSVSKAEKRAALIAFAMDSGGFPDRDDLEAYYTQEEIQYIKQVKAAQAPKRKKTTVDAENTNRTS